MYNNFDEISSNTIALYLICYFSKIGVWYISCGALQILLDFLSASTEEEINQGDNWLT